MNTRFDLLSSQNDKANKRYQQILLETKAKINLKKNLKEIEDAIVVLDYGIETFDNASLQNELSKKLRKALFFLVYNIKEKS